ncbi:MAG: RnfABCDGE type electron transport complex subunit D [Caldimonas sp.]
MAAVIDVPAAPRRRNLDPSLALALPLAFAASLAALGLLASVRGHPMEMVSFWGAAGVMALWAAVLLVVLRRRVRPLVLEIELRKQHYLQACAQFSVMLYWGWYWREVYDSFHLLAAQLLFAYAFDMLLAWSRRDTYTLGFGPFPIIFSINLFLWFKPDWFYLQFLMVAVGFLAKEFIRWNKDGRRVHIFNPSSFPLGVFSLGLILTGTTAITWGQEIAQTFELPPHIRLWIFLVALPGQILFGVTMMTMSAVLAVFAFGLAWYAIFGTPYFVDAFVPAAVFLGMHLLFTDPSTSPRTELGRMLYGVLYGLGVVALFGLLGRLGAPTFYDKLMAVPLMNMTIQLIDAAARSKWLRSIDPARLGRALKARQRNLAYVGIWALAFVLVSDPMDAYRPRRWVPFWQQACVENRHNGCLVLSQLEKQYCIQGSGWACNDLALLEASGRAAAVMPPREAFGRGCALQLAAACGNLSLASTGASPADGFYRRSSPTPADYPILLQEGQGQLQGLPPAELFERACRQGWSDGCVRLAGVHFLATGSDRDVPRAVIALDRACTLRSASACADLGVMLQEGDGIPSDPEKGRGYLGRACDGGFQAACKRLEKGGQGRAGG